MQAVSGRRRPDRMFRFDRSSAAAIGIACLAALGAGSGLMVLQARAQATDIKLQPHRAVYEIMLDGSSVGAGIVELSGRMVYELSGSTCAGFTQKMRMVTRSSNNDGETSVSDLRSTFVEGADSRNFRFETENFRDRRLSETTKGSARFREKSGQSRSLRIQLNAPTAKALALDTRALFPIEHSIKLIEAAQSGKRIFASDVYDGSDKGDKIYATTAAIGPELSQQAKAAMRAVPEAEKLANLRAWPMSLSYFDKSEDRDDAVPTYEVAFVFFENGISRRLIFDYGTFSLKGRLSSLTLLPPVKCTQ